jgi:hypothetical protein
MEGVLVDDPGAPLRGVFHGGSTMRASRVLAVTATACAAVAFSAPLAGADNGPAENGPAGHGQANHAQANDGQSGNDQSGNDQSGNDQGGNGQGGNGQGGNDQSGNGRPGNGPVDVRVDPYTVHQGGTIRITVDGCSRGGVVTSNAFPRTRLSAGNQGRATATARIFDRATPGTYNLAVRCNGSNRVATRQFNVVSGRGALGGLGGSVGPSSTETAVGAGLVATAAVGGTIFVARRRRTPGTV